ncbi:MAG: hypothetical protein I3273_06230 [Candidatus Moeniiplasma glomeromycotorum]|nr:hypothetical protein [Candidatus Moeniiplasma glomeromycotorum]MCE8168014.1 hypothetical protein [Candidatus Moeniiplasma glomeromycotorum]MCE8169682.1 hypothetical protein [Candidatus Moeniiplasma glomeromycotorum]
MQEILKQEKEAKQFSKWIISNSDSIIKKEIEKDKKSPTIAELLKDKPLFFILEAVKDLDKQWWVSWHVFTDLEDKIKENYQELSEEEQKLFKLKLINFGIKQTSELAERL